MKLPVVIIATTREAIGKSEVLWLLEDIWFYENDDAELQLECILRSSRCEIREVVFIMPCYVYSVDDLTSLYLDTSYGYPECWPDVYTKFEINKEKSIINVNGIEAEIARIKISLGFRTSEYTEIKVELDPPLKNKTGIFRLGLHCKGLIHKRRLFSIVARKQLRFYSYGLAPFSGSSLDGLLKERKIDFQNLLHVKRHVIYMKWAQETLLISDCTFPPTRSYTFGKCEALTRQCPPLERIAQRVNKEVLELKKLKSYAMVWEFNEVSPRKGQLVIINYFTSELEKWISQYWLDLVSLLLAIISLLFALRGFF